MSPGDMEIETTLDVSRDPHRDTGETLGYSHLHRMGDVEDRTEVRIFRRRDRKREDDKSDSRDPSRLGPLGWKDSGVTDRSFGRDDNGRSASPLYESSNRQKDFSDKCDRLGGERESSERRHAEVHRDGDDHTCNSSWHKNKAIQSSRDVSYIGKGDHCWKNREYKDRPDHARKDHVPRECGDQAHTSQKDWKNRGHSGESHLSKYASSVHCDEGVTNFHKGRDSERASVPSHVTPGGGNYRSFPKLKLKVGGIMHTLNADGKRQSEMVDPAIRTPQQSGPSMKKRSSSAAEPNRRRQRLILQEDSDEEEDIPVSSKERVTGSEEDELLAYLADEPPYSEGSIGMNFDNSHIAQGVRKSSRTPKKRVFDGDDDGDIEPKRRRKKKVEVDSDEDLYRIEEDEVDHAFAEEEEEIEMLNDTKLKFNKRRKKSLDNDFLGGDNRRVIPSVEKMGVYNDGRRRVPLTARQRALQSSKEGLADDVGATFIEFPKGLTQSAQKKPKEVLTPAERQLKKEEAAQKRRQQVEKAAKEVQATAIQKILCQDSQRKKREGKLQKQREEMEQEKKAAAMVPASNSIRWVLGPNGTEVSFSQDLELPKIFSGPLSYPGEREKCAGPLCTNAYRYRDSKTLLPLCSLSCYRAVQEKPSEAGLAH